jgi:hypothetical protein
VGLGDQGEQVAGEVDTATLMARPLERAAQGGDQTGVLVGDDESDPAEAALAQGLEEAASEHFVF